MLSGNQDDDCVITAETLVMSAEAKRQRVSFLASNSSNTDATHSSTSTEYTPLAALRIGDRDRSIRVRCLRQLIVQRCETVVLFVDTQRTLMQGTVQGHYSPTNKFVEGSVYCLSDFKVKRRTYGYHFSSLSCELLITNHTSIICMAEECKTIPLFKFNLRKLNTITPDMRQSMHLVDICSMVVSASPINYTKAGHVQRELLVIDNTFTMMRMTLWGHFATNEGNLLRTNIECNQTLLACGIRIINYEGTSLSTTTYSTLYVNSGLNLCKGIQEWYRYNASAKTMVQLIRRSLKSTDIKLMIANSKPSSIKDITILPNVKHFRCIAKINKIHKENMFHMLCKTCKDELTPFEDSFICFTCKTEESPIVRYRVLIDIADSSKTITVRLPHEKAAYILRSPATDLHKKFTSEGDHFTFEEHLKQRIGDEYTFIIQAPSDPQCTGTLDVSHVLRVDWG